MKTPSVELVMSRVCGGPEQKLILRYLAERFDEKRAAAVEAEEIAAYCEMSASHTHDLLDGLLKRGLVVNTQGIFWALSHADVVALPLVGERS